MKQKFRGRAAATMRPMSDTPTPPNPDSPLEGQQPEISYPSHWRYQVIGADPEAIAVAIADVVGSAEHTVSEGRTSSGGKWRSIGLVVLVEDEAQRHSIYHGLQQHEAIRVVL